MVGALRAPVSDCTALRPRVEAALRQFDVRYELRGSSAEELNYELQLPWGTRTDRVYLRATKGSGA